MPESAGVTRGEKEAFARNLPAANRLAYAEKMLLHEQSTQMKLRAMAAGDRGEASTHRTTARDLRRRMRKLAEQMTAHDVQVASAVADRLLAHYGDGFPAMLRDLWVNGAGTPAPKPARGLSRVGGSLPAATPLSA